MNRIKKSAGFTMIELCIAILLAVIVTSVAMSLYVTQHKQLVIQDQVSDMQSSVRSAAMELASKAKMAGYKVPMGIPAITAYDTNPDTICIVYDSEALMNVQLEWDMPQPSSELRCDGHDITGLFDDDIVFVYDPITRNGEFFPATHVQYSSSNIQHNSYRLSKAYKRGCQVYKMNRFKYYIDRSDPNHPNLMVQIGGKPPQIYAENITGLNFVYVLSSGVSVNVPTMSDMIREIVITVNSRNNTADQEFQDSYRVRSLNTRVKVRNLGVN